MAKAEHLAKLHTGVAAWNAWREKNAEIQPDLSGADLSGANLEAAIFGESDLRGAKLQDARLNEADLSDVRGLEKYAGTPFGDFFGADLRGAALQSANLSNARVDGANLQSAFLPPEFPGNISDAENLVLANISESMVETLGLPSDHNDRLDYKDLSGYD